MSDREDETQETAPERTALPARLAADTIIADRYRVLSTLGVGGSGTVYRARHVGTRREVALKVLHPTLNDHPRALRRFEREAHALADVSHPNITPTLDVGVDPVTGVRYQTTALLDGESLRAIVRRDAPMEVSRALRLMIPVLSALEAVHAAGIVHRDVKPENIMVTARGTDSHSWLLDFGVCKFDEGDTLDAPDGGLVGTPAYMSPEQAAGDLGVDARSDVWAAAAVLYELLAGSPPFHASTPGRLLARILTEDASPLSSLRPELPRALAAAIDRSLSRDPSSRHPSARAFSSALVEALDEPTRRAVLAEPHGASVIAAHNTDAVSASPRGASPETRAGLARRVALIVALTAVGVALARPARRIDTPRSAVTSRTAPPLPPPRPAIAEGAQGIVAVDASVAVPTPALARERSPRRRRETAPRGLHPYEIE